MEQETKQCPYCGEEILAVAKKCKHCGEWLEHPQQHQQMTVCPTCGEETPTDNPMCQQCGEPIATTSSPTQQPVSFSPSLVKGLWSAQTNEKLTSWLPLIVALFTLIIYVGQFVSLSFMHYDPDMDGGMRDLSHSYVPVLGSLIVTFLIVWLGLKYSRNLSDPLKTQRTLKTWIAFNVSYLWWPISVLSGWVFNTLEIHDVMTTKPGYVKWMLLCFYGSGMVAFVGWIILMLKKDTRLEQMIALFAGIVLLSVLLLTIAFVMSFGYFSFFLGGDMWL